MTTATTPFLERQLPLFWRVIGWLSASSIFYTLLTFLGGPAQGDASQSVYSTWALAHGRLSCVYPSLPPTHLVNLTSPTVFTAPLYPIFAGVVSFITRIGHASTFPSARALGPGCINAFPAMFHYASSSGAITPTLRISYLLWPLLATAVIWLFGTSRPRAAVVALLALALTPSLYACLTFYFHPEDILALALALAATAALLKSRYALAGILIALACCSQQYALLVALPLLVLTPRPRRLRFALLALATLAVVDLPLVLVTHGRAIHSILVGSSRVDAIAHSYGGTLLYATGASGTLLFFLARIAPLLGALLLTIYAARRFGSALLAPAPLLSLLAACLTLRLVFEENLFGYYFLAASVTLLLADLLRGHLRGTTLAWLGTLTLFFSPINTGYLANVTGHTSILYYALPVAILVVTALAVLYDATKWRAQTYKLALLALAVLTVASNIQGRTGPLFNAPHWLFQLVLVPTALTLAVRPLLATPPSRETACVPATVAPGSADTH